jgi:hypothetical protein
MFHRRQFEPLLTFFQDLSEISTRRYDKLRGPSPRRASGPGSRRVLTETREPVIVAAMAISTTTLSARAAAAVPTKCRWTAIVDDGRDVVAHEAES